MLFTEEYEKKEYKERWEKRSFTQIKYHLFCLYERERLDVMKPSK